MSAPRRPRRDPRQPSPPPAWRVAVSAHRIEPRWEIPGATLTVRAHSQASAVLEAARELHRRGGLPPWRPLLRVTVRHATVIRGPAERGGA